MARSAVRPAGESKSRSMMTVQPDLPVAWGEGGAIELLGPATEAEIEWVSDVYWEVVSPSSP